MVELLQLVEASLAVTAVAMAVVIAPAAIMTGADMPDVTPLVEEVAKDLEN